MEDKSLALQILEDYKKQNKRQFVVICVLLAIIFTFIGGLVYVVTNYDFGYEEYVEDIDTGHGNICVGDECRNGDLNA